MTRDVVRDERYADGPIAGLRVVEIGDLGEVAGKLLADAGADVVRVEPPAGASTRRLGPFAGDRPDPAGSLRFAYFNTNKRGVTLDLASGDGRELWRQLVASSDVVLDAAGVDVLDAADSGFEACTAPGPADGAAVEGAEHLVWCSITPFGREGPWRDWSSNDLVQLALGGPMWSNGYSDHNLPPIRPVGEHSLWIAGEYAVVGILAALLGRARVPDADLAPELIDLAIHDAVSATTEGSFANWEYRRQLVQRQTGRHSAPSPTPECQFPTGDGRHLNISGAGLPRDPRYLDGLLDWMEEHDAVEDLRDPKYREAIASPPQLSSPERQRFSEVVTKFVSAIPAEEASRRGQSMHLPWAVVRRPEENLEIPHWEDRGAFLETEIPGHPEPVRIPRAPYRFTETPLRMRRRAPLLGEHNHEVYVGELGLSPDSLLQLAQLGVV